MEEFEAWVKTLSPQQKEQAEGFFTVIRRRCRLFQEALRPSLIAWNTKLIWRRHRGCWNEAAALTDNASLKKFLTTRAAAFSSNDYFESDMAWMDLDAPVDVTIGPYETYNDELFGYKVAV